MASETYYFFFSIILVIGAVFYTANLVFLRASNMTLYGLKCKPGTPEHERIGKFASNRNIALSCIVALIFAANLVYDIQRLLHLSNRSYAHSILIYAPVSSVIFFTAMVVVARNQYINRYKSGRHG